MKTRSTSNGSKNDNWETPEELYNKLNEEFNFDFDPCPLNHDLNKWNGLEIDWGKSNFVNPPYSNPLKDLFIKKGFEEYKKGKTVVFLIPVSTDTKAFHEYIYPYAEIRFLKGRVKFKGFNSKGVYVTNKCGQTGSMICILKVPSTPQETVSQVLD